MSIAAPHGQAQLRSVPAHRPTGYNEEEKDRPETGEAPSRWNLSPGSLWRRRPTGPRHIQSKAERLSAILLQRANPKTPLLCEVPGLSRHADYPKRPDGHRTSFHWDIGTSCLPSGDAPRWVKHHCDTRIHRNSAPMTSVYRPASDAALKLRDQPVNRFQHTQSPGRRIRSGGCPGNAISGRIMVRLSNRRRKLQSSCVIS